MLDKPLDVGGETRVMNVEEERSIAKRHHTVPQFYLRGFAEGEMLTTVRLPGAHRFLQVVRKAASETNFYAVQGHEDGPDVFEKMLSSVEGEAARVLEVIGGGTWPLEPADRMTLAYFIAVQAVRGPEQRRNMEYVSAQATRLEIGYGGRAGMKGWLERNRGVSVSDEQAEVLWEQATQPGGPPIRVSPIAHIKQIATMSEELLKYISGRPWSLVRFDKRSLITSDVPVGLVRHADDEEPWMGVGYMTAWGITFPLTRKLGLLMSDPMVFVDQVPVEKVRDGNLDTSQFGTTALEKLFNEHTVMGASEWLYHHPDDERFVPTDLPAPTPVTMQMSGGPDEFSGEPLFNSTKKA